METINNNPKSIKVCLAASAGGHISQLIKLSNGWNCRNVFCITTTKVVEEKLKRFGHTYVVGESNHQHLLQVIAVLMRCLKIVVHEKPDVVISTGAAAGCIACFLGKFIGAKVVWIDSVTNVERLSLSGRMVRYIADLFLVQWPELAKKYKNVEYCGTII